MRPPSGPRSPPRRGAGLKREPRLSERSGPWAAGPWEALIDALALCRASRLETMAPPDAGSMSTCKEARLVTAVVAPANVGWETGNQTRLAQRPAFRSADGSAPWVCVRVDRDGELGELAPGDSARKAGTSVLLNPRCSL